jgi:hypothetical protein
VKGEKEKKGGREERGGGEIEGGEKERERERERERGERGRGRGRGRGRDVCGDNKEMYFGLLASSCHTHRSRDSDELNICSP